MAKTTRGTQLITNVISVFENITAQLIRGVELCEREKLANEDKKAKAVNVGEKKVDRVYAKATRKTEKIRTRTQKVVTTVEEDNGVITGSIEKAKRVISNLGKLTD